MPMKGNLQNGMDRERAKNPLPEWATTNSICLIGIAFAMEYVHLSNWLHRDMNLENVLLNNKSKHVLADFGLAKPMSGNTEKDDSPHMTFNISTPFHMAPAIFMDNPGWYGQEGNVYSFAFLMCRLFTPGINLDADKGP
jgi:serine/threonine protein kinase